jgi:hypothetical protein
MPLSCIYCGSALIGAVSPAHIVPEGMGGRLASDTTVCNDCNNSFANAEGTMCLRLAKQGALANALRGDNRAITAVIEHQGSKYHAERSRMDELAKPPSNRGRVWDMPARREDQIRVIVTALRSRRLPPEAMLDGRFKLEPDTEVPPTDDTQADPIDIPLVWCDRLTTRLMVKMSVELVAKLRDNAARRFELEPARRFARYDEGGFYGHVDTATPGAQLPIVDAPYVHAIETWTSGVRLHHRMILFTELRFVGSLTHSWSGSPFRCSYSFNVQNPADMLVQSEAGDGAALVNKSERVRRRELDASLARLEDLSLGSSARRRTRGAPPISKTSIRKWSRP